MSVPCLAVWCLWTLCWVQTGYGTLLETLQERYNANDIKLESLGSVGNGTLQLLGNYNALSFIPYRGAQNFSSGIAAESSGLIFASGDIMINLGFMMDSIASIRSITALGSDSFIINGNGDLGGYDLQRQIHLNLTTLSMTPIFENALNEVRSVFVDDDLVYFGGNFTYVDSNTNLSSVGVALWNCTNNKTYSPSFLGFGRESIVNSIMKIDSDNILFTGKFNTIESISLLMGNGSNPNSFDDRNVLTQLGQIISLKDAIWHVTGGELNSTKLMCPSNSLDAWTFSGTSASLRCDLPFSKSINKLRLYNSHTHGNEVSAFRIITYPSNGIMNLTYLDPVDGVLKSCDQFCPMYSKSILNSAYNNISSESERWVLYNNHTALSWSPNYQEFVFVDSIPANSIEFMALSSYGSNLGLMGLELYQSSFTVYANKSLNEGNCDRTDFIADVDLRGNWIAVSSTSYLGSRYTPFTDQITPKISFNPKLSHNGNYSINVFTPGCEGDGTCSLRGIVNATVWETEKNSILSTRLIYQNNQYLKYDNIFTGYLETPIHVTLELNSGIYTTNSPIFVVADYIELIANELDIANISFTTRTPQAQAYLPLNGVLLDRSPNLISSKNKTKLELYNTSLSLFAYQNFPNASSIYASYLNKTAIMLATSEGNVTTLSLGDKENVNNTQYIDLAGKLNGMKYTSSGAVVFGEFDQGSNVIIYRNNTNLSVSNITQPVTRLANLVLDGIEYLVFDNRLIYNTTSRKLVTNTSSFELSLWSSGKNEDNNQLFAGGYSSVQYPDLTGAVEFNGYREARALDIIFPYQGVYLNQNDTAYVLDTKNGSRLVTRKSILDYYLPAQIHSIWYSQEQSLLGIGTGGSQSELKVFNISTNAVIVDESLPSGSVVSSLINFERNSTLLVGGDYYMKAENCRGICTYSYLNNHWMPFIDNAIKGVINDMQLVDVNNIVIAGLYNRQQIRSINLGVLNMDSYTFKVLITNSSQPILGFISTDNQDIIAWNSNNLIFVDRNDKYRTLGLPDEGTISNVQLIDVNFTGSANSYSLLIVGNFSNDIQGYFYNSDGFDPYFTTNWQADTKTKRISGFLNTDQSHLQNSRDIILPANNVSIGTSPTSTSSPQQSSTLVPGLPKAHKIHRGWVVLIGLALAIGTVSIIGLVGVLVTYSLKDAIANDHVIDTYSVRSNQDLKEGKEGIIHLM